MGLRVLQITPFAWSQPHEANEHVAACAHALALRGHEVTIVAPSNRARDLAEGRRKLRRAERDGRSLGGLVAIGPAVPVSRRSQIAVPVAARANLSLILAAGDFDVVHAHDPGLPSLSYLALRDADAFTVATFHSVERLAHPPGKAQREKLLARIDALTAVDPTVAAAAAGRFPGDYQLLPSGIETAPFEHGGEAAVRGRRLVIEWDPDDRARVRAALRALKDHPDWTATIVRTTPLAGRPVVPPGVRARTAVVTAADARARAEALLGAAAFLRARSGLPRLELEARAAGLVLLDDVSSGALESAFAAAPREAASLRATHGIEQLGAELEKLYDGVRSRRRERRPSEPLADRAWILADLHLHTEHSHDCSTPVAELLDHAVAIGLGAIAVTDHNVFSGATEALELARGRDLVVIPGEEVKTERGEVIGLFLEHEIPRGMSMAETVRAIREQGGIVYLPHPFDRLHAIPKPETLHRLLADIDVIEVFNARLLFDAYNDEALRFARKYNVLMGAGSDAHVLQGVGTGMVRMRAFDGPEEFAISLRSAEIVRRPKSLLYLQGLKWVAQARERRTRVAGAR